MGEVKLTKAQRQLARHALGLTSGRFKSYRNRYAAGHDTKEWRAWTAMVVDGHARKYRDGIAMDHFELTRTGAEAALNPGEAL